MDLRGKMNFLEELKWRGMIHDITPGTDAKLAEGSISGYVGFDPLHHHCI